jgi:hypothetical protein
VTQQRPGGDVEAQYLFSSEAPGLVSPRHQPPQTSASGSAQFDRLRAHLIRVPAVRSEVESALQVLIDRVNPSDRGARFVIGTAVEWILAAAAWEAGVITTPGGHSVDGFDLQDVESQAKGLWSVKSSFRKSGSTFRITNGMGGAGRGLTDPTVFLHPRLPGAVLVHPDAHPDVAARVVAKADGTDLAFRWIDDHALANPECVIELRMPENEGRGREDAALLFTKGLLSEARFPRLSRVFAENEVQATSLAAEIGRLAALRDAGELSPEEYTAAKARLLRS